MRDDDLALLVGHLELAVLSDFRVTNIAFAGDFRGADGFFAFDPRGLGFALGFLAALGNFGLLGGFEGFNLFFLLNARFFLVADDLELLAFCFHRGAAYGDIGLCINRGPLFLRGSNNFGQAAHTDRVKGVIFVERLKRGLVKRGQGHGFQRQAVFGEVFGHSVLHLLHKVRAVFVQLVHRHLSRHGAQAVNELTFDHFAKLADIECPSTKSLGRASDAFIGWGHRDIEFHANVHPHAVFGDQRAIVAPLHLKAQGFHVYRADFMQQRDHEDAAVHDDFLAARAGAHEADFSGGAFVKPRQNEADE